MASVLYVERLEQFFEANDLTGDAKADKRRATFLSVIGPAPYKLLRSQKKRTTTSWLQNLPSTTVRHLPRSCSVFASTPGRDRLENL